MNYDHSDKHLKLPSRVCNKALSDYAYINAFQLSQKWICKMLNSLREALYLIPFTLKHWTIQKVFLWKKGGVKCKYLGYANNTAPWEKRGTNHIPKEHKGQTLSYLQTTPNRVFIVKCKGKKAFVSNETIKGKLLLIKQH